MRCHKAQRLLLDYIGDELSREKRAEVEQHLKGCWACQAELARLQRVWDDLARQALPQKGEEFWQGFTARVMREVRRGRPMPAERKAPLFFPGWRVLLPAAAAAAGIIIAVLVSKGDLLPGRGHKSAQDAQGAHEALAEVVQSFSLAPLAAEDEDPLGRGVGLNGSAQEEGITFKPAEQAALIEAASRIGGDEDQLEELDARQLERFEQLLSARYALS
jgi:hypothetical protein